MTFIREDAIGRLTTQGVCSYFVLMPERNKPHRNEERFLLSHANANRYFVRVRCTWCNIGHIYHPSDLEELLGNIPVISLGGRFRCEACGSKEYMDVRPWSPTASEMVGARVRRIKRIYHVRKVEWQDVDL